MSINTIFNNPVIFNELKESIGISNPVEIYQSTVPANIDLESNTTLCSVVINNNKVGNVYKIDAFVSCGRIEPASLCLFNIAICINNYNNVLPNSNSGCDISLAGYNTINTSCFAVSDSAEPTVTILFVCTVVGGTASTLYGNMVVQYLPNAIVNS